jgi:hypothetical protein
MATTSFIVDSTAYVEISTTGTALVTNESSDHLRIRFAAALPAANVSGYLTLKPNQGLVQTDDIPTGNIYARADKEGYAAKVTVS